MRSILMLVAVVVAHAQIPQPPRPAPIDIAKEFPKIPNEWIVVFHPEASHTEIDQHMKALEGTDATIKFKYNATKNFRGYSMKVPDSNSGTAMAYVNKHIADKYQTGLEVQYIEQNGVVNASRPRAACNTQFEATWGLVRTGQNTRKIDGLYTYADLKDKDVRVYVMDTGIYRENVDFGGRAIWGADFTTNNPPKTDINGHGTHCAGTVMGEMYGVVKDLTAVDVRVLGDSGSGSWAGVIGGIDYVASVGGGKKSVASMSLGGGKMQAVNDAVDAAVDAGVVVVVAAGNSAMDACEFSPASATKAITVMCSTNTDEMCYFSNYGSCSDIIAPGYDITSAWIGSKESDNTISGTSMSAPHVAGVAARILSHASTLLTPAQVKSELVTTATKGIITKVLGGSTTPNLLLKDICVGDDTLMV